MGDTNNLLISGLYYIFIFFISLFSIFAVYLLVRYGRSIIISLLGSLLYVFVFLTILNQAHQIFKTLVP